MFPSRKKKLIRCKHCLALLVFLMLLAQSSFSFHVGALEKNGVLLQVDNSQRLAYPDEKVEFNLNITQNRGSTESFIIRHAWANSTLDLPMAIAMADTNQTVYDSSPFGNDGMLHNFAFNESSGWVIDKNASGGSALAFDGIDDYVEVPDSPSLHNLMSQITIVGWYKPLYNQVHDSIVSKHWLSMSLGGANERFPRVQFRLSFQDGTDADQNVLVGSTHAQIGKWSQFVGVYDGLEMKVYLNGNLDGSLSRPNKKINMGNYPLWIGGNNFGGRNNGVISEVQIYNRALSSDEIKWLYNRSWNEKLSSYQEVLETGKSLRLTFDIEVPEGTRAGYTQKFLVTAFPQFDHQDAEVLVLTVEVLERYSGTISLDQQEKLGKPGSVITFHGILYNVGSVEDTYDIAILGGENWNLSFSPKSIALAPGEREAFTISLSVPPNASQGSSTSFEISAASAGDPTLVLRIKGTAFATGTYSFILTSNPQVIESIPGSEVTFSLQLRNSGTENNIIDLYLTNTQEWFVKTDAKNLSLERGKAVEIIVRVEIPRDVLIGQKAIITILAVSRGDPNVSAKSSVSVEIVTPFWQRPDVFFLVGLAIGIVVGTAFIGSIILKGGQGIKKFLSSLLGKVSPFSLVVLGLVCTGYPLSNLMLGTFLVTLTIYILRRLDPKLFIGVGILLLALSGVFFVLQGEIWANTTATSAYLFLAGGFLGLLVECMRSKVG